MKNRITYSPTYKGLSINTSKHLKLGAYTSILESAHKQITALLSHHSRITILVFQLHVPYANLNGSKTWNQNLSEFRRNLTQALAQECWGSHENIIFNWAREVGKSDKEHYHCFIGFKQHYRRVGAITPDGYTGLWGLLESLWRELGGGFLRPTGVHTVNRGVENELRKAFYHLSYLAKVRDKDFGTGESHKRHSASRLKPKPSAVINSFAA